MTDFQLDGFTQRSSQLLERTRAVFNRHGVKSDLLPSTMQPSDGPIKLVFVGQYSSGKSSIIKMLTGIDTAIGAAITTDKPKIFPWNDLEVVDTPGIHTGITDGFGSDHDQKTYEQIDHAALLIFVITNEGFDNYIGKHFRKLAIEQDRAKNMVLVVNKMDRTSLGNVPQQQKVLADDLSKVIEPYKTDQLYLSFLSTEMYFEGQNESDAELKEIYFEQSGREQFIKNLNAFVASRGVLSKVQAPLETLKKAITNVIGDNPIDNSQLDAAEDNLDKKLLELNDGQQRFKIETDRLASSCANQIRAEGANAARAIEAGASEEAVQQAVEDAQRRAEECISECQRDLNNQFIQVCNDVGRELIAIDRPKQSFRLSGKLDIPQKVPNEMKAPPFEPNLLGTTAKQASAMTTAIPFMGDIQLTSVVKGLGHAAGIKFAPWGAANLVKGFSNVLGVIGAAYTLYQLGEKIFGTNKEQEMQNKLREARNTVRNSFDELANFMQKNISESASAAMEKQLMPTIDKARAEVDKFKRDKERLKALNAELTAIKSDVDALMNEVQSTARA